jgi:hypothetical protein
MKAIQTLFQSILFILSFLTLGTMFYLLLTRHYDSENLVAILVFAFPVLISFVFSGKLLIDNK